MSQEFPQITDEEIAKLKNNLGIKLPVTKQFNKCATIDTISHFVYGVGDENPLFCDEEYARKTRWGGVIAPPTFLFPAGVAEDEKPQGLPGVHAMWGGSEFYNHLPIRMDDRLTLTVQLSALEPKVSKFSRRSAYQEWTFECHNQKGELIAEVKDWVIRTERDSARSEGKYSYLRSHRYTEQEIKAIESHYEKEEIRGGNPRYWEDVEVGDELTPIVKGPLTVTDMIAFKIGWGFYPYCRAHRISFEYKRRHQGAYGLNDQGVPDVVERVHWENEYAQKVGVPAAYDYGPERASWMGHLITNWMGDDGFIKKLRAEMRRFNLVGDTTWCKGKVTKKYFQADEPIVECEIWAEDQRGETTARGNATILLPSKEKGIWPAGLVLKRR